MRGDRTAFAFGIGALALAGLGLWANYGEINWRLVGISAPFLLVAMGAGMLLLTRKET